MGWIIDAVIGVLLLIVLLINLFMGFQKCGLNNAFTALNVVLSCVLASVISGALISGPLASVVEGSGEGSELMGTLLSIGLFVVLMLVFSLIFSVWFPMRATSCLLHSVRKAYGVPQPPSIIGGTLRNLLFTLWLIVTIAASIVLTTVGRRALEFVSGLIHLPEGFIDLWGTLRFVFLGVIMLLVLVPLNMLARGHRCPLREVVPGVLLSMLAWLTLSVAFSYYVETVAHYTELYGSIATIVVVLLWLYMSGQVLIMGAEYNGFRLANKETKIIRPPEGKEDAK